MSSLNDLSFLHVGDFDFRKIPVWNLFFLHMCLSRYYFHFKCRKGRTQQEHELHPHSCASNKPLSAEVMVSALSWRQPRVPSIPLTIK